MSQELLTPSEYVLHHLTHLQIGQGFWAIHLDSVIMTILVCSFIVAGMVIINKSAKLVPGVFQNIYELIITTVIKQVKDVTPHHVDVVGPFAFSLFMVIMFMNFLDLLPVDTGTIICKIFGIHSFKIVPTTDINVTLGLALFTLFFINSSIIKTSGLIGFIKGILSHPYGLKLFVANIIFRMIEEFSRVFSLAMRLFGNIFAGEVIFILLATAPLVIQFPSVILWAIFHILIVVLQAFIFMMLSVVNFGLALEHE
jgi:F-type H+-transporting ATPase subunit a